MNTRPHLTFILAVLALVLAATPATADPLDEAKANGYVGEQTDGYIAALPSAPASARSLVADINVRRRAKYAQIATRNGTPIDVVASLAGKKLMARTPSGQYVRNENGKWQKKP